MVEMEFARLLKHAFTTRRSVKRHFTDACLAAIAAAIREAEAAHSGEIRFAVEAALEPSQVMRGMTPRERALEVFSLLRVWDTERNNGVLIYLLHADHAVEIVADRGIHAKSSGGQVWQRIVGDMQSALGRGEFQAGALQGIRAVGEELRRHFPVQGDNPNELPNEVRLL
jgi:uncharacterized membrane protein